MKKYIYIIISLLAVPAFLGAADNDNSVNVSTLFEKNEKGAPLLTESQAISLWNRSCNVVWTSQSLNSAGSMPCGGGDIGLNVWVENDELLFYMSRSGAYDEHNALLKQGRVRLALNPNPFPESFRQELILNEGYVAIQAGEVKIDVWVDVFKPVIHLDIDSKEPLKATLSYENWRYQDRLIRKNEGHQNSYKWAPTKNLATTRDSISVTSTAGGSDNAVVFFHRNPQSTLFDVVVRQQNMSGVISQMYNPLSNQSFGGMLWGRNLKFEGCHQGKYIDTDYKAWRFVSPSPARQHNICIALAQARGDEFFTDMQATVSKINAAKDRKATRQWWNAFWQRSYIMAGGKGRELARNYTLFRYMLGCNAYGSDPTKFNGGLFTFDPSLVDPALAFTPDYRKWGGGTMTAQNQRLVYWPMLKSGDFDMMKPQFDFYNRMLPNAQLRSMVYWQHEGACFAEQIENFGLPNPSEYGWKRPSHYDSGMEYNAWLEYEWDTVLEFCQMIMDTHLYNGDDITHYRPLIESSLLFFDRHYRYLASQRGRKELDGNNKLILYPGSACETYKMTYNASSTLAALHKVIATYNKVFGPLDFDIATVPDIPLRMLGGRQMIAPAVHWERINNVETPQLYPVFPWRIYGVGRDSLQTALNTYLYDEDALRFRSHIGWKQDNIFAACLGLKEEAQRLCEQKLSDGPFRFPAFWGPGFDWAPDHNWGGSATIGLQEMLVQENADSEPVMLAAWPENWPVRFSLCISAKRSVRMIHNKKQ